MLPEGRVAVRELMGLGSTPPMEETSLAIHVVSVATRKGLV